MNNDDRHIDQVHELFDATSSTFGSTFGSTLFDSIKNNDHRHIGQAQELFFFDETSPVLVIGYRTVQ